MSSSAEEIQTKIEEINEGMTEVNRQIHSALQGAVDKVFELWWVPGWLKEQVENKAQEAWGEFLKIAPKLNPGIERAFREITDYGYIKTTGPQYCAVDFSGATAALGPGSLGPRGDDWYSGNTENYRNAVHSLPTKLQNLQDAVEKICEIFSDLKEDYDSYFVGLLMAVIGVALAVAGLVVAVIGLVAALPTAGAGLALVVIGVVVAVVSLVVAAAAFFLLPDMDANRASAAQRLTGAATSVSNSEWPARPALDSGDWR